MQEYLGVDKSKRNLLEVESQIVTGWSPLHFVSRGQEFFSYGSSIVLFDYFPFSLGIHNQSKSLSFLKHISNYGFQMKY